MSRYLWLILFGMLGALSRYTLECLIQGAPFPLATLCINIIGCFAITFFTQSSRLFRNLSSEWRFLISTGFIGSFTTFSAFLLEVMTLIHSGQLITAAGYFIATTLGGFAACALGYAVSHSRVPVKEEERL